MAPHRNTGVDYWLFMLLLHSSIEHLWWRGLSANARRKSCTSAGRDFQGKGKTSLVFSKAEERILTERILQKLQNRDASRSIVKDMILQEFEIIKRDKPERNLPNSLSSRFLYGFFARNNLNRYSTLKPKSKVKKLQKYQDLAKKFLLINKEFIFL